MRDQPPHQAASVDVDRDRALTVTWVDGHVTTLGVAELRERCPCVACVDRRRAGEPTAVADPTTLRIAGAELVGGWGLGLAWSDGHNTGVYEWQALRSWCACPDC